MSLSFVIAPPTFTPFDSEDELIKQCKKWGLLSDKAGKSKAFYYKGNGQLLICTIIGYTDPTTAVIAFEGGEQHCIHPAYLREMQAANYGQRQAAADDSIAGEAVDGEAGEVATAAADGSASASTDAVAPASTSASAAVQAAAPAPEPAEQATGAAPSAASAKAAGAAAADTAGQAPAKAAAPKPSARAKKTKLELPEGKVKMSARVKEFTTVPNHFAEEDDEVVIYDAVFIEEEPRIELDDAWSSHSATLKKAGLEIGDQLIFDAKVVAKKLTRHPVPYKINNPAKIQKQPQE